MLYAGLEQKYGEDRAFQLWNWSKTDSFVSNSKDINGEPTLEDVDVMSKGMQQLTTETISTKPKQGLDIVYRQLPHLAEIGSPMHYTNYLATIFPDSKIQNILFHEGSDPIEKFRTDIKKFGSTTSKAVYFSPQQMKISKVANFLTGRGFKTSSTMAIANITNPLILSSTENTDLAKKKYLPIDNAVNKINEGKEYADHDAVVGFGFMEDDKGQLDNLKQSNQIEMKYSLDQNGHGIKKIDQIEIAVLNPDNIHILGSKDDITGFKKWMSDNSLSNDNVKAISQTENNPLKVDPAILTKAQDSYLIPIRDAAGNHTGQWFDYTTRQVPAVASMTNLFMKEYDALTKDSGRQDAMKTQNVGPVDYVKGRVLDIFKTRLGQINKIIASGSTEQRVVMPIGTSGSGKSTWINSLPKGSFTVISPDDMRVEFTGNMNDKSKDKEIYEEVKKRTIAAVQSGKQVIIDSTNLQKDRRRDFVDAVKSAVPNASLEYKLLPLNAELAKQRIKADIDSGKNRAAVPDSTIDRHAVLYKEMLEDIKQEPLTDFDSKPVSSQMANAQQMALYYQPIIDAFSSKDGNGFWEYTMQKLELQGFKVDKNGTIDDSGTAVSERSVEDGDKQNFDGDASGSTENPEREQQDWQVNNDSINMMSKAGPKLKGMFLAVPDSEFVMSKPAATKVDLFVSSQTTRNRLGKSLSELHISEKLFSDKKLALGKPFTGILSGDVNKVLQLTPTVKVTQEMIDKNGEQVEMDEGRKPQVGDYICKVSLFESKREVVPTKNFLRMEQSADQRQLWLKVQGTLVDTPPNLQQMMKQLKTVDDATVQNLVQRLSDPSVKGEIGKELVKIMSAQSKSYSLVTFTKGQDGHMELRASDSNQNSELKSLVGSWKENQKQADIINRNETGQMSVNREMAAQLWDALQKGGDAENRKALFERTLRANGIELDSRAIDSLMNPKQFNMFSKQAGSIGIDGVYGGLTQDGKAKGIMEAMLGRLTNKLSATAVDTDVQQQEEAAGEDEQGQKEEWQDNNPLYTDSPILKILALAELPYSTIKFSSTIKNLNGDSVQAVGMNNNLSHTVRGLRDNEPGVRDRIRADNFGKHSWAFQQMEKAPGMYNNIRVGYTDGLKNRYGQGTPVNGMSLREKQLMRLGLYNTGKTGTGSYISLTHSDKTLNPVFYNMPRMATSEVMKWNGEKFGIHPLAIEAVYGSAFMGEYKRMTRSSAANVKGFETGKNLFYTIPMFNKEALAKEVGNTITQEEYNIIWAPDGSINPTTTSMNGVSFVDTAKKIVGIHLERTAAAQLRSWTDSGMLENGVPVSKWTAQKFMVGAGFFIESEETAMGKQYYVVSPDGTEFRSDRDHGIEYTTMVNQALSMDFAVNDFLHMTSLAQMFYGDPAQFLKAPKGSTSAVTDTGTGEMRTEIAKGKESAVVNSTLAEYSKRMAGPIAPGMDSDNSHGNPYYTSVTLADYEPLIKELKASGLDWKANATDAQQFATMREWLHRAYAQALISEDQFKDSTARINNAKGGYYEFAKDVSDKIYHLDINPAKPMTYGMNVPVNGVARVDYGKTSTFYLYPPMISGWEADKLRAAMEHVDASKGISGVDVVDFISGRKVGAPAVQVQLFDKDGRIDENIFKGDDWKANSRQNIPRDNMRFQQEIHAHEDTDEILMPTQAHVNIVEGLANMPETIKFSINGKAMSGQQVREHMEDVTKKWIGDNHKVYLRQIGAEIGPDGVPQWNDIKKMFGDLANYTKGQAGYQADDFNSLTDFVGDSSELKVPFWLNKNKSKLELKLFAQANSVKEMMIPGKAFVQVSPAGLQTGVHYWEDGKFGESEMIWATKFEGELKTAHIETDLDGNKTVRPAQVLVSQDYFASTGLDLNDYLKEVDGKKMLDMTKFPKEMLQLVGVRIPNQGFGSMLPTEIVGFMPAHIKSSIIVPAAITKQMGGDFDVDKLYTFRRGFSLRKDKSIVMHSTDDSINDRVNAKVKFLKDWEGDTRPDKELREHDLKDEQKEAFEYHYNKEPLGKQGMNAIKTDYFGIHWGVLTSPAMFSQVMSELDKNDLADEKAKYGSPNTSQNFFTSVAQDRIQQELADAKIGVAMNATKAVNNVKLENKDIMLATPYKGVGGKLMFKRTSITVLDKDGNEMQLSQFSGFGTGEYDGNKRTKGQNAQLILGAAVDNAKDRNYSDSGFNKILEPASAAMTRLQTDGTKGEDGWIMDLSYQTAMFNQPIIKEMVGLISKGSDNMAKKSKGDLKTAVIDGLIDKYTKELVKHMTTEDIGANKLYSAEMLEKASKSKQGSVESTLDQLNILKLFKQFDSIGSQVITAQSVLAQNTKGAGKDMLEAKFSEKKISKFDTLSKANPIILHGMSNVFENEDGTENELGAFKRVTLDTTIPLFGELFPIYKMEGAFDYIHKLTADDPNSTPSKSLMANVMDHMVSFLNSHGELGLFTSADDTRRQLMLGDNSLARRLQEAQNSWAAEDPFLRPDRLVTTLATQEGQPDLVTYQAFGMTDSDVIEGQTSLLNLIASGDEEKSKLGSDLIRYLYATGGKQNAKNFMKFVGHGIITGTSIADGQRSLSNRLDALMNKKYFEQYLQHNPGRAAELPEVLGSIGLPTNLGARFKLALNPEDKLLSPYMVRMSDGNGGFTYQYMDYISFRDKSKAGENKWRLFKQDRSTRGSSTDFYEIDTLGDRRSGVLEYSASSHGEVGSLFKDNRAKLQKELGQVDTTVKGKDALSQYHAVNRGNNMVAESVGLIGKTGGAAALDASLRVIASDSEQADYLKEIATVLLGQRTGMEQSLYMDVLGQTKPLTFSMVDNLPGNKIASFKSSTNELLLGPAAMKDKNTLAENIVHEMLHYNTALMLLAHEYLTTDMKGLDAKTLVLVQKMAAFLNGNPDMMTKLDAFNNVYKQAKAAYATDSKSTATLDYAFSNSREFMSHIFSNEETMKYLNTKKFDGEKSILDHIKDVLAKIWNGIVTALGGKEGSLLEESIKRGLDVVMTDRMAQYSYEQSTTPDPSRFNDPLANSNISATLTTNQKILGKLLEQRNNMKLSLSGVLSNIQRIERNMQIEDLDKHIKQLQDVSTPVDAAYSIGEQWIRGAEKIALKDNPTPNEMASAIYVTDMWKNMGELLAGDPFAVDVDGKLDELVTRAQRTSKQLIAKGEKWLEAELGIGEDDLTKSLIDTSTAEAWGRPLSTSVSSAISKTAQEIETVGRASDEERNRAYNNLDKFIEDMEKVHGKKSHIGIMQSFLDKDSGRLVLQHTQHWFNLIHGYRVERNGAIYHGEKAMAGMEEMQDLIRLNAWTKYRDKVEKVGVYVDVNKFLEQGTGAYTAGLDAYKKELGNQIGHENVDSAIEIAQHKYMKYLDHYNDTSTVLDSKVEPLDSNGTPILSEDERVAQGYYTQAEADALKLKTRNQYSPGVITSTSSQRSLIAAYDDYIHLIPKTSSKGYWDERYKEIQADPKLQEFYDRFSAMKMDYQKMMPIDGEQARTPGFMPVVHSRLTSQGFGLVDAIKEWYTGFNERMTKKLAAGDFEGMMNQRAFDKIPTPFIREDDVALENRSRDVVANMKLFAAAAVHYKHASAAKDMIAVVKSVLADINRTRQSGVVQDEVDGKVVTVKAGINNALKSLQHLEDSLIYRRPKRLEGNSGGKLYAKNEYTTNEAGERILKSTKFSNPLNPITYLGGTQTKIGKEIEAIMLEKTEMEKKYAAGELGGTETQNEDAYQSGLKDIEAKLSKYSEYTVYGSKVGDFMMENQMKKALGFNPFSAFSNVAFGIISTYIHAAGGADFDRKGVNKANGMMVKALRDKELAHKIHAVMDRLGVIGDILDVKYGKNDELKKRALKKYADPFYLMRESDFFMKGVSTLATLFNKQVDVPGGKMAIWDTLDKDGNWDAEKHGEDKMWYDPTTTMGVKKWDGLRNYVARVNMIIHGNQDKNSPMMHKGYIMGRLLGQFRSSWFIEGFFNRFQSEREDNALGRTVKGRYITFQSMGAPNSFKVVFKSLLNMLPLVNTDATKGVYVNQKNKDGSVSKIPVSESAVDMENLKRNMSEVKFYLAMMSAVMLLKGLKGDDDDKDTPILNAFINMIINMGVRSRQDINLYASPSVFDTVFRNPIPAFDAVKDFSKMVKYTSTGWMDFNYRDGFSVDKDFSLEKWLTKVAKGNMVLPEAAIIPKVKYMLTKDLDKLQ